MPLRCRERKREKGGPENRDAIAATKGLQTRVAFIDGWRCRPVACESLACRTNGQRFVMILVPVRNHVLLAPYWLYVK